MAFTTALPVDCPIVGKGHTVAIERDNSNTRYHLGQMTTSTKVMLQKEKMVHASLKLWCALTEPATFQVYQETFLSIFI